MVRWMGFFVGFMLVWATTPTPARGADDAATKATTQTTQAAATTQPDASHPKLKVGVLVSHFTATGPSRIGRPYGYDHVGVTDSLRHASVQLFPLIEKGSESDEELAKVIAEKFPESGEQAYFADDIESLKSLNAIVISRAPNLNAEVIEGVTQAVNSGVGLLVIGPVGVNDPGYAEPLNNLLGMSDNVGYAFCAQPLEVELLAGDDPLIKDLGDAAAWTAQPNGVMGAFKDDVKPLIKISSTDQLVPQNHPDADFHLLYQHMVGHGPVIVCNWSGVMPDAVEKATESPFYVRCIHRLVELRK